MFSVLYTEMVIETKCGLTTDRSFLLQSDLESCVADSYSDLWDGLNSYEIRNRRLDGGKRIWWRTLRKEL